jgi:hypothetical protein
MAMKDLEDQDLAVLPAELRQALHRVLYRQECRAILFAIGIILSGQMLVNLDTNFSSDSIRTMAKWYFALLVVFLTFWVIYPSQSVLIKLRKIWKPEDGNVEGKFDNQWQSIWDFIPPLILTLGGWVILWFLQMLKAM